MLPSLRYVAFSLVLLLSLSSLGQTAQERSSPTDGASVVQATLIAPGSTPFQMKATVTERDDPASAGQIEILWMSPDTWRRTIQSDGFSQTVIVNDGKIFEEDSDDYFPMALQTLVTAIIDPKPVLEALRPGDRLMTKANGASKESGEVCFAGSRMCMKSRYGLLETVGAPGRAVDFTDYRNFHGKRVARLLTYHIDPGTSLGVEISQLKELKDPDPGLFSVEQPT